MVPQIQKMHTHRIAAELKAVLVLEYRRRIRDLHRLREHVQEVVPAAEVRDVSDVHARRQRGAQLTVGHEGRST